MRKDLVREIKGVKATRTITIDLTPAKGSKLPAIICGAEIEPE
jgi:hypothetical protein